MNDRVNKAFPYDKEGVSVTSKLDELMMQYYRVPNGEEGGALHVEAFEVGQKLQYYFAVYSATIVNESIPDSPTTPRRNTGLPSVYTYTSSPRLTAN